MFAAVEPTSAIPALRTTPPRAGHGRMCVHSIATWNHRLCSVAARFGCAGPLRAGAPEDWAPRRVQSIDPSSHPSRHTHPFISIHTTYIQAYVHPHVHPHLRTWYIQSNAVLLSLDLFFSHLDPQRQRQRQRPPHHTTPPPKHLHLTHTPTIANTNTRSLPQRGPAPCSSVDSHLFDCETHALHRGRCT